MKKRRYQGEKHDIFVRKANSLSTGLEDVLMVSRLATGVGIVQGLNNGTIDVQDLARELIGLPPESDLDKFKEEDVDQLIETVEKFITAANDGCSQDGNPCFDLNVVKVGFNELEKAGDLPPVEYEKFFEDGSPFRTVKKVKEAISEVSEKLEASKKLVKVLRTLKENSSFDDKEIDDIYFEVWDSLKVLKTPFKATFIDSEAQLLTKDALIHDVDEMLKMETISDALHQIVKSLDSPKKKLEQILEKVFNMRKIMSAEKFQDFALKFKFYTAIGNPATISIEQKRFTHGFFEGAEDFSLLFVDVDSYAVKNKLIRGVNSTLLRKYLAPLEPLSKETLTVHNSFHNETDVTLDARAFLDVIKVALSEIGNLSKLNKVNDCLKTVPYFDNVFDMPHWKNEKSEIVKLGDNLQSFVEELNKLPSDLPEGKKLSVLVYYDMKYRQIVELMKTYPKLDKVISEATAVETSLTEMMSKTIEDWSKSTRIDFTIESNEKFQCAKDKKMHKEVRDVIARNAGLPGIQLLKSDNPHFATCRELLKRTKLKYSEFRKLANKLKNMKFRLTEKPAILGQEAIRDLNHAIKLLRDFKTVLLAEDHLKNLLSHESEIDEAIRKSKNVKAKEKLAMWWNTETKNTMKSVLRIAAGYNNKTITKPSDLTEYIDAFIPDADSDDLVNVDMQALMESLIAINSTFLDAESEDKLKLLNLYFAHSKSILKSGEVALTVIISYFANFGSSNVSSPTTLEVITGSDENTGDDGMSMTMIGGIIGGLLVLLIAIGVGIFLVFKCKNMKKEGTKPQKK